MRGERVLVSRQIVIDTIKRMYASGVDDETIKSTLRDIGLKEHEIRQYLKDVKGGQAEDEEKEEEEPAKEDEESEKGEDEPEEGPGDTEEEGAGEEKTGEEDFGEDDLFGDEEEGLEEDDPEKIASKTAKKIKTHLDEHFAGQEINDTATLNALEEQKEDVGELHKKLDELHEKFSSQPVIPVETIAKINSIEKKVIGLEKEMIDIKASQNALNTLLKKILEANQQILNKLKK